MNVCIQAWKSEGSCYNNFWISLNLVQKLFKSSKGNFNHLLEQLASFDKAVAIQVASLLQESGYNLSSADFEEILQKAAPVVREGFKIVDEEWQLSQKAQND